MSKVLDITQYTEVDPNSRLALNYASVVGTGVARTDGDTYAWKDYGVGYFNAGLVVRFSALFNFSGGAALGYPCFFGNALESLEVSDAGTGNFLGPRVGSGAYCVVGECINGVLRVSTGFSQTNNTQYYYTLVRDETAGTYGSATIYCYSDAARATLVGSSTLSLNAKQDFRYFFPIQTYHDSGAGTYNFTVSDITLTKFEDLTAYTETDPGSDITITGDKIATNDLVTRNTPISHVTKDFGAGYFNGNVVVEFEERWLSTTDRNGNVVGMCCFSQDPTFAGSTDGAAVMAYVANQATGDYRQLSYVHERYGGAGYYSTLNASKQVNDTWYYITMIIDRATGGTYGTCTIYIYSNAVKTTLAATVSLALHSKEAYRYLSAIKTFETGGAFTDLCDVEAQNFAIVENHRFEDFNAAGWTEVDPNSRIARAADGYSVIATALQRNETAYAYRNYGAAHFNGNLLHEFGQRVTTTTFDGGFLAYWMLSNYVGDVAQHNTATENYLGFFFERIPTTQLVAYLCERDGASVYTGTQHVTGTSYRWARIIRDETVGSYGTLYLYLYTNAARTTLEFSSSLTLHSSKKDFSNLYISGTNNNGDATPYLTGGIYNLDLNQGEFTTLLAYLVAIDSPDVAAFILSNGIRYGTHKRFGNSWHFKQGAKTNTQEWGSYTKPEDETALSPSSETPATITPVEEVPFTPTYIGE